MFSPVFVMYSRLALSETDSIRRESHKQVMDLMVKRSPSQTLRLGSNNSIRSSKPANKIMLHPASAARNKSQSCIGRAKVQWVNRKWLP